MYTQVLNAVQKFNADYGYVLESLHGIGVAYNFTVAFNKEKEVKQGGNDYFGACAQMGQLAPLVEIVNKIALIAIQNTRHQTYVKIISNVVVLLSIPACLFFAMVKQGHYPSAADWWNSQYSIKIPSTLGVYSTRAFSFLADHFGDMMRVAMIAGSVTLIALRQYAFAGAILGTLGYEVIDQLAWVPRKVSLFVERYMPVLGFIGMATQAVFLNRVIAICAATTALSSTVTAWAQLYFDKLVRRYIPINGPTIAEIRKPVVKHDEMTFEEMVQVLEASNGEFELNPAHCIQSVVELKNFPSDDKFEKLLTLFDTVNWTTNYALIKKKFQDDDRFISFLAKNLPTEQVKEKYDHFITQRALPDAAREPGFNFDFVGPYIAQLAAKKQQTEEEWAKDHLRTQMGALVDVLEGRVRVKGVQQDLEDGIQNLVKILPYLESLDPQQDRIELEDLLLKIAVEGGAYCARAIKRVAGETMRHILQKEVVVKGEVFDPFKDYERQIQQALQEKRYAILQAAFDGVIKQLLAAAPNNVKNDVHTFDLYRLALSYGFVPLTDYETREMGITHILNWEMFFDMREQMRNVYLEQLKAVREEKGEVHFGGYMAEFISQSKLTDKEKEDLLEMYTERHNNEWSAEKTADRFYRLMLYKLGVVQYKNQGAAVA